MNKLLLLFWVVFGVGVASIHGQNIQYFTRNLFLSAIDESINLPVPICPEIK